jgi:hypothetical protein
VEIEDYTTCGSALKVCGIQSVIQVLDQDLPRPEEEEKEEVAEHKATFLYALKGQVAVRKYMFQFDTKNSITAMCNKVENELYRIRTLEKKKE